MKKIIKYIYLIPFILLLGCSKDLGNYSYKDVNDVNIVDGVLDGDHNANRIYRVPFDEVLNIAPVIEGTVSGKDVSKLDFEWIVDGETVSTEKDLAYTANQKFGKLNGQYKITDQTTGIVKTYNFFIEIINQFKNGYYFLSQKANKDAVLYCISTLTDEMEIKEVSIPSLGELGKNPIYLGGITQYGGGPSDFWNTIYMGVKDANYPIAVIDSKEFIPFRLYSSASYTGSGNFTLAPTQVWSDENSAYEFVYIINEGKYHTLSKGRISSAYYDKDPLDYEAAPTGLFKPTLVFTSNNLFESFFALYDEKNQTVRVVTNQIGIGYDFVHNHDYAIDKTVLEGHKFLFGSNYLVPPNLVYTFVTTKQGKLYCFEVEIDLYTRVASNLRQIGVTDLPNNEEVSKITFNEFEGSYLLAMGQTIYRMQNRAINNKLELETYIKLPVDARGEINNFDIGAQRYGSDNTNLFVVTTVDKNSADEKNSSIYIYNTQDLKLFYTNKNAVEEVKGLYVGL